MLVTFLSGKRHMEVKTAVMSLRLLLPELRRTWYRPIVAVASLFRCFPDVQQKH
jgi:hypothetical protein